MHRLTDDLPVYEQYAEIYSDEVTTKTPAEGIKISANAATNQFNLAPGPKTTSATQDAVNGALQ